MTPSGPLYVGDLVGSVVVNARGKRLGHVVDVVLELGRDHRVSHLEIGASAWLHRWGIKGGPMRALRARRGRRIRWADVAAFDGTTLSLR